jgi:tRNA(Ile)-lysidine synthase
MIHIQGKLKRKINVACSGGVDSIAVVDFLLNGHDVNLLFFDHGTETSKDALEFLTEEFIPNKKIPEHRKLTFEVGTITRTKKVRESWEEYWRNQRYEWFHSFEDEVITCHHLDDCVETWIWSSLNGEGRIIPYRNRNVIRPFRFNRKQEFINWCNRKGVAWIEDASNDDTKFMRNFIRQELMPKALVVNPGLHKVIRKKVENDEYQQ